MAKIEDSMPYLLENEGGLTLDDGGLTNFGIVKDDLAEYQGVPVNQITDEQIKALTKESVVPIYQELYWKALKLDDVTDQNIATAIFDTAVNRGVRICANYAQRTCVQLGHEDLLTDGRVGPKTLAAINQCARAAFIRTFEGLVWEGYKAILIRYPRDVIYQKGWQARAERLLTLI